MNSKRRGALLIIFYAFFLILTASKNAEAAIGLTPALVEIDFSPGYKFSIDFAVLDVDPHQGVEMYAKGDFAEYVTLSRNESMGGGGFTAYVDLPNEATKPGKNRLYIGAREKKEAAGGIGVRVGVEALIRISVPYPGKYAEISLTGGNVNEGEPVNFAVSVDNLGTESLYASPMIEIYSGNERINTLTSGSRLLLTKAKETFEMPLETKTMKPGPYNATVILDYGGGVARLAREFKIGSLFVNITNYTSTFEKGKINKFFIEIESQWNSKIDNIYVGVNVTSGNNSIDYFKTPSVSLEPWTKVITEGFFNAENAKENGYNVNITLFYNDKTTSKQAEINAIKEKGMTFILILALIIAVSVIVIILIIIFWWKHAKKKKKAKK